VEYAAGRKSPLPDRTRIYMDELTFWVVTHATSVERKGRIAQLNHWDARNPDIERIRFDML
jgi:hypothetical protein